MGHSSLSFIPWQPIPLLLKQFQYIFDIFLCFGFQCTILEGLLSGFLVGNHKVTLSGQRLAVCPRFSKNLKLDDTVGIEQSC